MPAESFRVVQGEELLAQYEWSPGQARVFCSRCGSPMFKKSADNPREVRLRLGCLDSELAQQPTLHVFVAEKPGWSEIYDSLPQFAALPARSASHKPHTD